jgi:tryptophan synthase beta chain
MAPLVKMHTLGHDFVPDPIHAGGLRYHGMAPLVSLLKEEGIIEAEALPQIETFGQAVQFARAEGIIPGPEPAHAVASAMMEAERAKEAGEEKVIVFNLSGHGHFDMAAYQEFLTGTLTDYEYPEDRIAAAMERVPVVAG